MTFRVWPEPQPGETFEISYKPIFQDYEPDYDALWDEYVAQDEMAIFYATHERVEMGIPVGASAQVGRNSPTNLPDSDQQTTDGK